MGKYIGKKIAELILTLIVVSFCVFTAFAAIPGDPAVSKLGMNASPERVEALREEMGLNDPFFLRYLKWMGGMLKGDLGVSTSYDMSVGELIGPKILINAVLSVMAIVIVAAVSIPLGIYTAKHTGSALDHIFIILNQICMSIPPFILGIFLTFLFGLTFHFFTPGGYISYQDSFSGFVGYLIFPSIALAIPKCAMCIKLLRTNILTESKKDYARTAYSRGNDTTGILYKHVLKNAIMPTITFIGMVFADMIASGIIIEQVFGIPGLGRSLIAAISTRDFPVVQAIVMIIAAGIVIISAAVDIVYCIMDPRVKVE